MLHLQLPEKQGHTYWNKLYGSSLALSIVEASQAYKDGPVVVIAEDVIHADALTRDISFYKDEKQTIFHLPDWETLPYDIFSPHQDIISERLAVLASLPSLDRGIVVVAAASLLQRLPPLDYVAAYWLLRAHGYLEGAPRAIELRRR